MQISMRCQVNKACDHFPLAWLHTVESGGFKQSKMFEGTKYMIIVGHIWQKMQHGWVDLLFL